ncbi:NAD(P)-dependent alcohol dehydrogenase [Saccharolobus solfataricus]|uniref:Alcohol dehydrogenase (Zn containing) (Adh-5) n=3 Tax=Saccharolobus solfataricus TaxID=2287 RepID=Q97XR4_SACS2|nr:NAD(P)-dependent alcohol dehydrogenase [Saccharolobus solfataricus]AAK41859.1 Alcohol dehydrogenase (Zn containing) (adh-5) [Saccharolobus solfataricus P2]AKA74591.1 NAD(P)-dependent alcohol dehydrogenase [Saccharolobus solfataricus]AKA77287.1 NAD(P)-dependent alcohol dehydrogenase [Saccharolobus solfataricus]AKA79979.1 NAD(P)-dependent alcohol dehydrogenase [Saccharolobus solfataricus]AZF69061.1 NAD(P)-dependent alcohol dehydrogenase [Saccharolobus solfataricus]
MKAVRIHEYNKPLSLDEVNKPRVSGPYDIVVRIRGAGVCRTDLHIIEGVWKDVLNPKLPFTIGHENVGIIEEKGNAVDWLDVGDQVILHPYITCRHCRACRSGNDMHCPYGKFPGLDGTDGGYAEYLRTSAFSAIKIPKGIDIIPMAPLADAGITAYHAVKKISQYLYPGSIVGVIGVGGLGHIGIQALKAITPARVIAIDISEEKTKLAKELGADEVVIAGKDSGVSDVLKLTDNIGVDAIIDFVGEHSTPQNALRMIRKGGIYSIVGYGGEFKNSTLDFINREIMVVGNLVGTYNELSELVTLYVQNKVKLKVKTFPLEEANSALEELKAGRILGRAVLVPS